MLCKRKVALENNKGVAEADKTPEDVEMKQLQTEWMPRTFEGLKGAKKNYSQRLKLDLLSRKE
jgi:hypothetical protein